jgi:hypothetical protein
MGVPLLYVIRVTFVLPEDDNDNPAFGDEDSTYISIDMEMINALTRITFSLPATALLALVT